MVAGSSGSAAISASVMPQPAQKRTCRLISVSSSTDTDRAARRMSSSVSAL